MLPSLCQLTELDGGIVTVDTRQENSALARGAGLAPSLIIIHLPVGAGYARLSQDCLIASAALLVMGLSRGRNEG